MLPHLRSRSLLECGAMAGVGQLFWTASGCPGRPVQQGRGVLGPGHVEPPSAPSARRMRALSPD